MELTAKKIYKEFIRKNGGGNILRVVEETDFTLSSGELVVISGRSGSGKSTFMNIMAGLLEPTGGQVLFSVRDDSDATDIYSLSDDELSIFRNCNFGYIPQVQSPIGSLNVIENVILPSRLYSGEDIPKAPHGNFTKASDIKGRAETLLEKLDIIELAEVMPSELSGGELRRVAIARALINNPRVIFADEPTGDLDDENTKAVLSLLREQADKGASVLLVTHENDAFEYGDRVLKMSGGVLNAQADN